MKKIKVGDIVEHKSYSKVRQVAVLKVKEDGKLILDTKKEGLCKNVCVKPHRVKLIK